MVVFPAAGKRLIHPAAAGKLVRFDQPLNLETRDFQQNAEVARFRNQSFVHFRMIRVALAFQPFEELHPVRVLFRAGGNAFRF